MSTPFPAAARRISSVPPSPPSRPSRTSSPPSRPSSPPLEAVRVVTLPADVRAFTIADLARDAMLGILRGIGDGWTKRDVAAWLAGPYRAITSFAPSEPEDVDESRVERTSRVSMVVPARLDDVLRTAKEEVLATLILAAPPDSDIRFAHRAVAAGHVVRTRDAQGRGGWTPVDAPKMLLADRVTSLAAVDYLMRPADYLALLSVCGVCQAVSFDAQVRVRGRCSKHTRSLRKIPVSHP
jgi:hypothetical protein